MSERVLSSKAPSLEKYLDNIIACPDEFQEEGWKIALDYGVYDNWSMLVGTEFDNFLTLLKNNSLFIHIKEEDDGYNLFDYQPGTGHMQVRPHKGENKEEYPSSIMFHCYQEFKMPRTHWLKAIAYTIEDVCRIAIDNDIPLLLPDSIGWRKFDEVGYDNVEYMVSYKPE